jgi:hypothetical protein
MQSNQCLAFLSLMNPVLCLLSTLCAHPCFYNHHRWRIWWWLSQWVLGLMSTSRPCPCVWSFRERSFNSCYIIMYETMWDIFIRYVISTMMILLIFVNLCVRLFPGVHMSPLCILFLSLKMGVTDWYQSRVDCRTQA